MGALVMLIIQFAIGMIVNLYSTIPAGDQNSSFWAAIGRALADGPAALTVHAILGLLLVVATVALVVRAVACRHVPVIVASSIGLLAVLAAASSGSRFVSTGSNGAVHRHGRGHGRGHALLRGQPVHPRQPPGQLNRTHRPRRASVMAGRDVGDVSAETFRACA